MFAGLIAPVATHAQRFSAQEHNQDRCKDRNTERRQDFFKQGQINLLLTIREGQNRQCWQGTKPFRQADETILKQARATKGGM